MEGKHIAGTALGAVVKVVAAAVIILYVYRFTLIAYDYGFRLFGEPPMSAEPGITVTVPVLEGRSVREIGEILQEKGLIRDAGLFFWQEKLSDNAGKIKPGVYELNTSMTAEEMIAVMASAGETMEDAGDGDDTDDEDDIGTREYGTQEESAEEGWETAEDAE